MSRSLLVAAPLLVAGLVLSACGGSSTGQKGAVVATSTTTMPPTTTTVLVTRADYVKQANAICQTMNDRIEALGQPGDPAQLVRMMQESGAIVTEVLAQLRALPMPPGEQSALATIYSKVDILLADVNQEIAALQAGDQQKAMAIAAQLDKDQQAANDASNEYGLTVCGS